MAIASSMYWTSSCRRHSASSLWAQLRHTVLMPNRVVMADGFEVAKRRRSTSPVLTFRRNRSCVVMGFPQL